GYRLVAGPPYEARVLEGWRPSCGELCAELDATSAALPAGGPLVLEVCAWDRLDESTADWFEGQRRTLAAARGDGPPPLAELRAQWDGPTADELRSALGARFAERAFEWAPFLH